MVLALAKNVHFYRKEETGYPPKSESAWLWRALAFLLFQPFSTRKFWSLSFPVVIEEFRPGLAVRASSTSERAEGCVFLIRTASSYAF